LQQQEEDDFINTFHLNNLSHLSIAYWDHINRHVHPKQVLFWVFAVLLLLTPLGSIAQDSLRNMTRVSGKVLDATTGLPLASVSVSISGSNAGTSTNSSGAFDLSAAGAYKLAVFSHVGYLPLTKEIHSGEATLLTIRLHVGQTRLKEVDITARNHKRYRNKGNPAVELIQQVIDHKKFNQPESADYLQYNQYERIGLSFYHLSSRFINGAFFSKYKFVLDTTQVINGQVQTALPVYFNEKLSQYYYRKNPEKTISIITAQKQTDIIKFIDTAGLDIYMNRLYGNKIDIYENNIFIITNQFLSPIADHSPDFYKFFIVDTIRSGKQKLVELSFTPRNKGDLLFEGRLLVTLDGRYAVAGCELNVNRQININFMRSLNIKLDFMPDSIGHYYLKKSDVKADFGLFKNKGLSVFGERSVFYSDYQVNKPLEPSFYKGKSFQIATNSDKLDTNYWARHRTDTLTKQQAQVYAHVNRLENMRSFKTISWLASTYTGGYADTGPVGIGPIGAFYSFNSIEGTRFQVGGRTTPKFNQSIYLEGYGAYGTTDDKFKYNLSTYIALNKTPFYQFPNDFFKISYLYDIAVPGHSYAISNQQAALSSFHSGKSDFFLYSRIFSIDYVKDFENHFSYDITLRNWTQQAAGTLVYQYNDPNSTRIDHLTTSEVGLSLRYAPHEQILQGTQYRRTIYSKYPIFYLQINHDFKDVLNGSYNFTNINATVVKRFYLSQLGYTDVTLLGSYLAGKVPFPLLNISPANQSLAYQPDAYNLMDYLEFVSDHYVGINITQSFNGFFLNKIPLIDHLKWREYLSFKALYGGLRNENNPLYSGNLYKFPLPEDGTNGTYALGSVPYIEAGAGIGNIFKFLRIDMIRRFDYLNHPGVSPYGIKFNLPDLYEQPFVANSPL
jgi:hypothetical protein